MSLARFAFQACSFIIGALEPCCRRGEMPLIQNKRVNWDTFQIGIPGAMAKAKENRRIPFNPEGRLAAILERRAKLGPDAYVFGSASGACHRSLKRPGKRFDCSRTTSNRDRRGKVPNGIGSSSSDRSSLARSEARRRVSTARRWRQHSHDPTDARSREHSANATLSRNFQQRVEPKFVQSGPLS
jgi:hypothetical protein